MSTSLATSTSLTLGPPPSRPGKRHLKVASSRSSGVQTAPTSLPLSVHRMDNTNGTRLGCAARTRCNTAARQSFVPSFIGITRWCPEPSIASTKAPTWMKKHRLPKVAGRAWPSHVSFANFSCQRPRARTRTAQSSTPDSSRPQVGELKFRRACACSALCNELAVDTGGPDNTNG